VRKTTQEKRELVAKMEAEAEDRISAEKEAALHNFEQQRQALDAQKELYAARQREATAAMREVQTSMSSLQLAEQDDDVYDPWRDDPKLDEFKASSEESLLRLAERRVEMELRAEGHLARGGAMERAVQEQLASEIHSHIAQHETVAPKPSNDGAHAHVHAHSREVQ
jgi:hypothetical protein